MMLSARSLSSFALAACLLLVGCGEGGPDIPKTVEATGKVTVDGAPVEGATVVFGGIGKDSTDAYATTNIDGTFKLQTAVAGAKVDGAVPGSYQVSITKTITTGGSAAPASDSGEYGTESYVPDFAQPQVAEADKPKTEYIVPQKYNMKTSSGLTADVTADGENNFEFALSSAG